MRLYTLLFFASFSLFSFSQKKHVCFTLDDLPVVSYRLKDPTDQKELSEKLIFSLNKYKIPAIGFVNEKKLFDSAGIIKFQVDLLKSWIDRGLELGNHTFSHPDYNNVSLKQFSQDVLKGEIITRELLHSRNMTLKYFRHPFLHAGNTKEKADSLKNFLVDHGYIAAPVTIDNEDYLFAAVYEKSKIDNDTKLMKQIGHDYLKYMEKKVIYYEHQANKLFGRNINQILLIHASFLNSDYMDSLALMFVKNNYDFISMDKALEDKVYETEITRYGNWGISWLDRWALSQGKKSDFFKDEPVTPEYINKLPK
jgi:peptidoglycan/xylan/chitin deacetylase (PgdA/CDA1 family)